MDKKNTIVICGPTACGKTQVAIALAKIMDSEIISADSMQIYKGMDIGTAKPTMDERDGVPHHLIDIADPRENFSAANFQHLAQAAIENIHNRKKVPILAGGTGFYINSAVYENILAKENTSNDMDFYRELMNEPNLHDRLKAVDPESAKRIHINNKKRVARALAYYLETGKPISKHAQNRILRYNTLFIVLVRDRNLLYQAIDRRVVEMISAGLEDEVKRLVAAGVGENTTAMQAIGYKEMIPYLKGQCSIQEAQESIQQNTRRYAKRQMTWFRHQISGYTLHMDGKSPKLAAEEIIKEIKNNNVLRTFCYPNVCLGKASISYDIRKCNSHN